MTDGQAFAFFVFMLLVALLIVRKYQRLREAQQAHDTLVGETLIHRIRDAWDSPRTTEDRCPECGTKL